MCFIGVYCNAGHLAAPDSNVESISLANTYPLLCGTATWGDNIKFHSQKVLIYYDTVSNRLVFVSKDITPIAHIYSFLHEKVRLVLLDVDGDGKIDTMLVREDIERAMQDARQNRVSIVKAALNSTFIDVSSLAKACVLVGKKG